MAVSFNEVVSGTIEPAIERDVYLFEASAGDLVFVSVVPVIDNFDPDIDIWGPDGTRHCGTEVVNSSAQFSCPIEADGIHQLMIGDRGLNDVSDYDLFLQLQ